MALRRSALSGSYFSPSCKIGKAVALFALMSSQVRPRVRCSEGVAGRNVRTRAQSAMASSVRRIDNRTHPRSHSALESFGETFNAALSTSNVVERFGNTYFTASPAAV